MRKRYWLTVVLAGFAIYSMIGVLGTFSSLAYWHNTGFTDYDISSFVANRFLEQWTCAVFVAPLFWLVERYPLTVGDRGRNAFMLFGAIVLFVFIKYAIQLPLFALWTRHPEGPYIATVIDNVVPVLFDFAAITGVAHALRYYREVRDRERAAAELKAQLVQARLDVLRGQLHPHFLFNGLNAAATLMHEDVNAADRMLTELGDLLRTSLERSQAEITLGEELDLASRYLAIMQHRFSDRLRVRSSVDDSVRGALVPTLLMQPLLENALEHGIARRPGVGIVEIAARRENGALLVSVTDDGPGPPDSLSSGIGLSNTRARLEQLYGSGAALVLESADGIGARAIVRIPYREQSS
ncbi:MAG: sensor histidine kinase [Gemmatimonadales bacterium]